MTEYAVMQIRSTLAMVYRGEIEPARAMQTLQSLLSAESLAEFVVEAFNRGWITRSNLGIDEDGIGV